MLEALGIENLDQQIAEILESDLFQAIIYVVMAYIVLIWLASAYWAYRDMSLRSSSAITPYVAALAIIVFTPIFFLFGLLVYRIVRPKETIAEVNERTLAEEAMLAEIASHAQCANCSRPVNDEWIICPGCRNRLRRVCPNCEHLIELDWTLCAWCGKDFERAEAPGTVAFMPSARPAPLPQPQQPQQSQQTPRMPAPRPPAPTPGRSAPQSSGTPAESKPAGSAGQPGSSNPAPPTRPQGAPSPAPRSSGASTPGSTSSATGGGAKAAGGVQPTTGI
jgi:hypothetical protein